MHEIKCYRVVHKDGSLSSNFAFGGINKQAELLINEGIEIDIQKNKVKNV
jgi:alkylated DNA nucleotide flippase Atl1